MSEHSLTITLMPDDLDPGQGGAVWVRLEPLAARADVATVADAARVIDELFQIEPCAGGLGTGGLEVEVGPAGSIEPPVAEPAFDQVTKNTLGIGVCQAAAGGWSWEGRVRVLRSHVDYPYVLRVDQGAVIATERVDEIVETAVLFDNANTATLDLPVSGPVEAWWGSVVTRSGVEPTWRTNGPTVNLDRRATGQLNLRYRTVHDLVTVKVSGRAGTEQLQQALCLCFYRNLVADCTLEPPAVDDRDLARLQCTSTGRLEDGEPGECYETVTTRTVCACSGETAHETTAEIAFPCPDGSGPGRHYAGNRAVIGGTTWCPEERDETLFDPVFQRSVCCREVTPPLACVRETWRLPGGRGISGGDELYRSLYGGNVRLVPLTPEGGDCGKLVLEMLRISRNCCDLAEPVSLPPEMVAAPGIAFLVEAGGGVPDFSWEAQGGISLVGTVGGTQTAMFLAGDGFCGTGAVMVEDACGSVDTMVVRSTEGKWEGYPVTDPCMDLPGYTPGAADDGGPSDLCDPLGYTPKIRTSGEWRVQVGYTFEGLRASCPEPLCGKDYITMITNLGQSPGASACERGNCPSGAEPVFVYSSGDGCCTVHELSTGKNFYALADQQLVVVERWVCA